MNPILDDERIQSYGPYLMYDSDDAHRPGHVGVSEARETFAELVNRAAYRRERVLVSRRGRPIAAIVPIGDVARLEDVEARGDSGAPLAVDARTLRRAQLRAADEGTSVDAVVNAYLQQYAGEGAAERALSGFLELAERTRASSGPDGRSWRRDDLYDRGEPRDGG